MMETLSRHLLLLVLVIIVALLALQAMGVDIPSADHYYHAN